jgi:hypothetical protein
LCACTRADVELIALLESLLEEEIAAVVEEGKEFLHAQNIEFLYFVLQEVV